MNGIKANGSYLELKQ